MAKYKHKKSKMIIDAAPYTNGQEDGFCCKRGGCEVFRFEKCKDTECYNRTPYIVCGFGTFKQFVTEDDYTVRLEDGCKYLLSKDVIDKNYRKVRD